MKKLGLLLVLAACGGKIEDVSSNDPTTNGASIPTATPTGTTTSVPPSPPPPGRPPPAPGQPPPSKLVLRAEAFFGGFDHVMVYAADPALDSCVRLHLASPEKNGMFPGVTAPKPWAVREITRSPGADRCGGGKQPPAAELADDAKGSVAFVTSKQQVVPCSIDVHVTAIFADAPTVAQLDGDAIPVEGCQ